jgi:hypothetical protein
LSLMSSLCQYSNASAMVNTSTLNWMIYWMTLLNTLLPGFLEHSEIQHGSCFPLFCHCISETFPIKSIEVLPCQRGL